MGQLINTQVKQEGDDQGCQSLSYENSSQVGDEFELSEPWNSSISSSLTSEEEEEEEDLGEHIKEVPNVPPTVTAQFQTSTVRTSGFSLCFVLSLFITLVTFNLIFIFLVVSITVDNVSLRRRLMDYKANCTSDSLLQ